MTIQLDRILGDIAQEKVLHPNYPHANKRDVDDAWVRVGKNNKLSVHEARSIFKVLQKKYEQERIKEKSAWKLFHIMEKIHEKVEIKAEVKEEVDPPELPMEEDEEYEMLEVQEDEEHSASATPQAAHSTTSTTSDGDSPAKSTKSHQSSENTSPERDEKKPTISPSANRGAQMHQTKPPAEEKKLLNTMASTTARPPLASSSTSGQQQTPGSAAAAALHKKGILFKRTPNSGSNSSPAGSSAGPKPASGTKTPRSSGGHLLEVGKTIQLPESIKRKLTEDQSVMSSGGGTPQAKRANVGAAKSPAASEAVVKVERPEKHLQTRRPSNSQTRATSPPPHGINVITIPANPTRADLTNGYNNSSTAGGATAPPAPGPTASNGISPRIEDIDFKNHIIFDAAPCVNGPGNAANRVSGAAQPEIINLGNFDNSLPPTFFKNLCNSSRFESLGLYVANAMNRLQPQSAAKLEVGILRAIIDVQSEELDQLSERC